MINKFLIIFMTCACLYAPKIPVEYEGIEGSENLPTEVEVSDNIKTYLDSIKSPLEVTAHIVRLVEHRGQEVWEIPSELLSRIAKATYSPVGIEDINMRVGLHQALKLSPAILDDDNASSMRVSGYSFFIDGLDRGKRLIVQQIIQSFRSNPSGSHAYHCYYIFITNHAFLFNKFILAEIEQKCLAALIEMYQGFRYINNQIDGVISLNNFSEVATWARRIPRMPLDMREKMEKAADAFEFLRTNLINPNTDRIEDIRQLNVIHTIFNESVQGYFQKNDDAILIS